MKKTIGALIGTALLVIPGAASAYYLPVYGTDVAYGVGGQNPYAGNCNYYDDCRFKTYVSYPSHVYGGEPTYWCNGYYSYTPCGNQYQYSYYPQYTYYYPTYTYPQYYYPQQTYYQSQYYPYLYNTNTNTNQNVNQILNNNNSIAYSYAYVW